MIEDAGDRRGPDDLTRPVHEQRTGHHAAIGAKNGRLVCSLRISARSLRD